MVPDERTVTERADSVLKGKLNQSYKMSLYLVQNTVYNGLVAEARCWCWCMGWVESWARLGWVKSPFVL